MSWQMLGCPTMNGRLTAVLCVWVAVAAACSGGGGGGSRDPHVCPAGDLECYGEALHLYEDDGTEIALVTIDRAELLAVPSPTVPPGPTLAFLSNAAGVWAHNGSSSVLELPSAANAKLWASGPDDVWAVGGAAVRRRTAGGWATVDTSGSALLYDVFGFGPNDVWMGGQGGVVRHWNGSLLTTSSWGVVQDVHGIAGTSPTDLWAVGGAGVIRHWNGASWTPDASGTGTGLDAVWASAPDDVWAGGNGVLLHRSGGSWSPVTFPDQPSYVYAFWGTAADDVWMSSYLITGPSVWHWDGFSWSKALDSYNSDVDGWDANDVWVTGEQGVFHGDAGGLTQIDPASYSSVAVVGSFDAVAPMAPPTFTITPAAMVFSTAGEPIAFDLEFTDPYPFRPGGCVTVCNSGKVRCITGTRCFPPLGDGLYGGSSRMRLGWSAAPAPATTSEALTVEFRPISSEDGDPIQHLGGGGIARVGPPMDVETQIEPLPEDPDPDPGLAKWDGGYTCNVSTHTPAGDTETTATFSCTDGFCLDPSDDFNGEVQDSGAFTGESYVCDTCVALPMIGVFDLNDAFEIHGSSETGAVTQSLICTKDW